MTKYESLKKWACIAYIARKIRSDREIDYPNFKTDGKSMLIRNLCYFATQMNIAFFEKVTRNPV